MARPLSSLAWMLAVTVVGFGRCEARPAGTGHGGGAGHALAGRGSSGRGYGGHYGYGRRYGYYGYPGYYGVGLGVGLGYYGYGYGYPGYCYAPGYGYPLYVDGNAPPPAVAFGPPPGAQANPPGAGPVRLTESDLVLSIHVPPDALVRINGTPTTQGGPRREFVSSGLAPGRSYTFVVAAHWTGPNGQPVDLERRLRVAGGERRNVDFIAAPGGE